MLVSVLLWRQHIFIIFGFSDRSVKDTRISMCSCVGTRTHVCKHVHSFTLCMKGTVPCQLAHSHYSAGVSAVSTILAVSAVSVVSLELSAPLVHQLVAAVQWQLPKLRSKAWSSQKVG